MQASQTARDDRRFLLLLVLAGIVVRLIWLVQAHGSIDGAYSVGEATQVALAVARGDGIADAYYPGYGPTAHLMPVMPGIAGFVLWLFGAQSPLAHLVLLAWSLAQVIGAWLLLRALFQQLGADPRVTRWGIAILALLAVFAQQEVIDFRYWEGALALVLALLNLLLIQRYEARSDLGWREMLLIGALSAITFFVCPPVGLAVDACWAIFALRRLSFLRCVQLAAISAAALAAVVAPWAIRNAQMLGEPVLLRSNFGLELALANHPDAVSTRPPENVFADRLAAIHPYQEGAARESLKAAGGEIAYARELGAQAERWIAENPGSFAQLSLRHLSEYFFPRPWQMWFTGWQNQRELRAGILSLVSLIGLIGLAIGLWQRRRGYWMLAIFIGVLALPYVLLQPVMRYLYPVHGLLAFLAVDAVLTALGAFRKGKAPAGQDRPAAASPADPARPYRESVPQTG